MKPKKPALKVRTAIKAGGISRLGQPQQEPGLLSPGVVVSAVVEDFVDISGLDEAELIAALHNGTRPLGMGMLHDIGRIDADRVRKEIADVPRMNGMLRFDYYHGRPLKVLIGEGKLFGERLYDRDAGQGVCRDIVAGLRAAP